MGEENTLDEFQEMLSEALDALPEDEQEEQDEQDEQEDACS
jgi:hypothetical protein